MHEPFFETGEEKASSALHLPLIITTDLNAKPTKFLRPTFVHLISAACTFKDRTLIVDFGDVTPFSRASSAWTRLAEKGRRFLSGDIENWADDLRGRGLLN